MRRGTGASLTPTSAIRAPAAAALPHVISGGDRGEAVLRALGALLVGGKLRILPEYRRQAPHLRSGLRFYAAACRSHPLARFYRMSLASIFGFTSIASFCEKPAARAYTRVNPEYRTNGSYVGFWFRFSLRSMLSLLRAIGAAKVRSHRRRTSVSGRGDEQPEAS